jgi:transcriptional regulator with XRE-family HTH domain
MPPKQRAAPLTGLREKRIFRNIPQGKMGAYINVSQSHYRQLEEGITRLDVHRAKTLADVLGCTIDDLL